MKKLLLLSTLFLAFACTVDDNEEEPSLYDKPFLEHVDGLGFVRISYDTTYYDDVTGDELTWDGPLRDKYLFFYDSDIFLKEVYADYGIISQYIAHMCYTMKEGSNTDGGQNFTADIIDGGTGMSAMKVSLNFAYDFDQANTIYGYKINWKNPPLDNPYSENEILSVSVASYPEGEAEGPYDEEFFISSNPTFGFNQTRESLCNNENPLPSFSFEKN